MPVNKVYTNITLQNQVLNSSLQLQACLLLVLSLIINIPPSIHRVNKWFSSAICDLIFIIFKLIRLFTTYSPVIDVVNQLRFDLLLQGENPKRQPRYNMECKLVTIIYVVSVFHFISHTL